MKLFRLITLPYWRRRALKTFLTVLGMASGIAVYTAIDLSNRSALRSFEESVRRIGGDADLAVVGRERKVADADYAAVLLLPGTRAATPQLEAQGLCGADAKTSFTLLGVDPLSRGAFFSGAGARPPGDARPWLELMAEPGTALVPATLAARCGIRDGEAFTVLLRGRPVALRARLGGGGDPAFADSGLIFADVATAQEALGELGHLTRIEIKLDPGSESAWRAAAARGLAAGLGFEGREASLGRGRDLLKAFQLNLLSLALVAVFVAVFIVYNSASLSVLHRRADLAVLRALGATRRQIASAFAIEVLLLGALSGLLGVALGAALARALFGAIAQTVQNLYLAGTELRLFDDWRSAGIALGLALGASGLGALVPLAEVFSTGPAEAVRRLGYERRLRRHPLLLAGVAGLMFAAAFASAALSSIHRPAWGFVTAFAVLLGFLTLTPGVMRGALSLLTRAAGALRLGYSQIACAQIAENPYRYGVVTAALALGVALWLGVSLMISSFRGTVVDWIGTTIRGDLYLTLSDNPGNRYASFLSEAFIREAEALPEVARRDFLRVIPARLGAEEVTLSGVELRDLLKRGQFKILSGSAATFGATPGDAAWAAVSESFARRRGLKPGDVFRTATEWGSWNLKVGAVLYDYTSERGIVYVERGDFAAFSGDGRIHGIALYLEDPAQAEALAARVRAFPSAPPTLEARPNREVRERVLRIFDETFQTTEALKLVALFVAFLGILTTLSILLEEKRREVGLLQALGATPAQLAGYALSQGAALGLCGWLLGALCGVALCWVIIRVINYDHFGWTIFFRPDWGLLGQSFALTMLVATLATLWPMRYLRKIQPGEALRFEE